MANLRLVQHTLLGAVRHRRTLATCRALLGALTLVAIGVQLVAASRVAGFHFANFFGYFTILSNAFAAAVLLYAAANVGPPHRLDVVRGAATVYLALVGIVFTLLLANLESNVVPWVNAVVHYLMPVAIVADWALNPPNSRLTAREALSWLAIPLSYVAYTLIRGSVVHWYPYPFLDVGAIGLVAMSAYVVGIFVITAFLAFGVRAVGNALRERRDRAARPPS